MDGAVHATAAGQPGIRRVDHRIHLQDGDVALKDLNAIPIHG